MSMEYPEWTACEWTSAWTIHVGRAYRCNVCGTMIMVTKGGIGNFVPICCDQPMELVEHPDSIADHEEPSP